MTKEPDALERAVRAWYTSSHPDREEAAWEILERFSTRELEDFSLDEERPFDLRVMVTHILELRRDEKGGVE